MISREKLNELAKKQQEINCLQAQFTDEWNKYSRELFLKAKSVLQWKDENLGQHYLRYTFGGSIKEIRPNTLVLRIPDTDPELGVHYYNVSFDEIYSDDWKEVELEKYAKKLEQQRKAEEEKQAAYERLIREEELAELKRLKEKYENIS